MLSMRLVLALVPALMLVAGTSYSSDDFLERFVASVDPNDPSKATAVVESDKGTALSEIKALLAKAASSDISHEDKESTLYTADLLSVAYRDATGDTAPLLEVKRAVFESRLSTPVKSEAKEGAHTVECPMQAGEKKNYFSPDNIVIKAGETVRWVNNDNIAHLFSSMPAIGRGGLRTPYIEPSKSWEYRFEKPGDYYYICFIHKGMVGKVRVEE